MPPTDQELAADPPPPQLPASSPLTPAELQAIADRQVFRNRMALISAVLQAVATGAFVIISIVLLSAVNQQHSFSERSDCKTTYASVLNRPVVIRDDLQASVSALTGDLESQLGAALLAEQTSHTAATQAQVDEFSATKAKLDAKRAQLNAAIADVMALPSQAHAIQYGFKLDGVKYPACPTAS